MKTNTVIGFIAFMYLGVPLLTTLALTSQFGWKVGVLVALISGYVGLSFYVLGLASGRNE